jgi:ketosteroid isomerase-like protein
MLDVFTEDPTWLVIWGTIVAAVLAGVFWQTRHKAIGWASLAVLALVGLGVLIERLIVTDREQIDALFARGVQAVEAGDAAAVAELIDPQAMELRRTVATSMAQGRVQELAITGLSINVNRDATPRTAEADVFVRFKLRGQREPGLAGDLHARLKVQLRRTGDRWYVIEARGK